VLTAVLRPALDALALRLGGRPAAAATMSRKRAIFFNALEYAVELGHLPTNPIPLIKWRAPKLTEAVNPRVVINHSQARALLDAVARLRPSLKAFFGVMYYAALRPAEAVDLRKGALTLPRLGWGELFL
jgi:integrase